MADNFLALFGDFYQNNVGGIGAPFSSGDSLENLGFSVTDLRSLEAAMALRVAIQPVTIPEPGLGLTVGDLSVWAQKTFPKTQWVAPPKKMEPPRPAVVAPIGLDPISERQFLYWIRDLNPSLKMTRDTLLSDALAGSSESRLLQILKSHWPTLTKLPRGTEKKEMTLAGLMGALAEESREVRKWDMDNCPRRG